ncbi:MAG: thioesterase II family protein [Kineosporiaceae bacterium]
MTLVDANRAWFPMRGDTGDEPAVLFCLPHAGGAASVFRSWAGRLPGLDVAPVQLPGRETRIREAPYTVMEHLAADLAAVIRSAAAGRGFALYGHSLGALAAFEVTRELRRLGAPQPTHLIVSGSPSPAASRPPRVIISELSTPELVNVLREMGGTPEWLLAEPEFQAMFLPAVRADFGLRERYEYRQEDPLDVPITVIASDDDPRARHPLQTLWATETTAGFQLHTLRGGHFAVFEQPGVTLPHLAHAARRR